MITADFIATTLGDTDRLGALLAELLPDGTTVVLSGTLGAGKTRLVQAVAAAIGVPRESVVSPTFVLCQEYYGTRTIYHLDAYRLSGEEEFRQLGPEEYFSSTGLVFIEWGERVEKCLPRERLMVTIDVREGDKRAFEISATGSTLARVVENLRSKLAA